MSLRILSPLSGLNAEFLPCFPWRLVDKSCGAQYQGVVPSGTPEELLKLCSDAADGAAMCGAVAQVIQDVDKENQFFNVIMCSHEVGGRFAIMISNVANLYEKITWTSIPEVVVS